MVFSNLTFLGNYGIIIIGNKLKKIGGALMARTIMVQCRICKEKFNRGDPNVVEGVDYVKPSKNMYYHKKCYDEYISSRRDVHANLADESWFDACWDLLRKDLKYDFNFFKVRKQWESYLKNKMTAKGIYFALKYHYEIRHGDVTKSENGIGIIPHIYEDSRFYWQERERRERGIVAAIEEQIKQAQKQNVVNVKIKKEKRPVKSAADMLAAVDMEDSE